MPKLKFAGQTRDDVVEIEADIESLIVAGWTGRDPAAVEAHIEELARLGVARPKTTPIFYQVSAANLTQGQRIQVAGQGSTGEVECVLVNHPTGIWLGVGSDHTDRKLETFGVTLSKQACAKPISANLWWFADVREHFDELILRSWATIDGKRRVYQEGAASRMLHPSRLLDLFTVSQPFTAPCAMFCGTLAVQGSIDFATRFEMELHDPVMKRSLVHSYYVVPLPIQG